MNLPENHSQGYSYIIVGALNLTSNKKNVLVLAFLYAKYFFQV